jgi:NitT/TauT family transport system substrate-binding protein
MESFRWLKKKLVVAGIFLLLITANAMGAELTKVTFAFSTIGPMAPGVWLAEEMGAFEKYGIEPRLVFISSGPVVMQALIGGDLDAGLGATNAVIAAALRGAPLISVLSVANKPAMRLWVQPEIHRIEDLKGKTLGVTRFGSVTHNLSLLLLRKYGLADQVKIRQMGGTIEVGAAFEQHAIAGAVTSTLRVDRNIPMRLLMDLEKSGIPYSMDVIAFQRDYYVKNPKIVEGIVKAYIEGVAGLHFYKNKALKAIAKYSRLHDPDQLEGLYQDSVRYLERVPRVEPEALTSILEFMGKKDMSIERFAENSIVDRLVKEGFIDDLYRKQTTGATKR